MYDFQNLIKSRTGPLTLANTLIACRIALRTVQTYYTMNVLVIYNITVAKLNSQPS